MPLSWRLTSKPGAVPPAADLGAPGGTPTTTDTPGRWRDWYLYQGSTIEYEAKLTGVISNGALPERQKPAHGTLVAPQLYGPNQRPPGLHGHHRVRAPKRAPTGREPLVERAGPPPERQYLRPCEVEPGHDGDAGTL